VQVTRAYLSRRIDHFTHLITSAALEFNSALRASSTTRTMSWSATRPSVAVWCKK
jgi:hypothetical protein